jgi:hypothetical protein
MRIKAEIKKLQREIENVRARLSKEISSLPDNPRIKRASGIPNCFFVNFSDIGESWSVEYHDFKKTYKMIVDEIDAKTALNAISFLELLCKKRSFRVSGANYTHRIHPDVADNIKQILKGV